MYFDSPLIQGTLIKRYKRFLADIQLPDGRCITAHCANTGAMTGCAPLGARVWLSTSDNPKRKYPHSWQLVEVAPEVLACINTGLTNKVVAEALQASQIEELKGYTCCQSEVPYGDENSRIDFLLSQPQCDNARSASAEDKVYVEVKHVTLSLQPGVGSFPDAVTTRGQKHLRELIQQRQQGYRAVLLFIIMRTDVILVRPEESIDPEYARLLRAAVAQGVEVMAYQTRITTEGIILKNAVPVEIST